MTNQVSIFKFEDTAEVRVMSINGEPWFVAADVCRALGYNIKANGDVNMTQALRNVEEHEVITTRISDMPGQPPELVSESGLYKLIIQSRKPEAREFKNWVTGTVLPAIRKDGAYIMGEEKPCNQLPCSEGSRVPARKETHMSKLIINREYEGKIFLFREDGYFNMTIAAKKFGKDLSNFIRSPATLEYLDVLINSGNSTELIQAKAGRYGGTWGHPKLATIFARWLDVKFAVWCDMVIDDILNKKAELTITKPEESMAMKVPQSFPEALRLAAELAERNEKLAVTSNALRYEPAT